MSRVEHDNDVGQWRVVNPRVRKLPPNPHFGPVPASYLRATATPSETTQTDSECAQESKIDKSLRFRLLASDQRSFFTGSATADLQVAHIINTIRKNERRKSFVESYLGQQRLQPPEHHSFGLDEVYNAILLESSLHVQWGLYGTYCFVPSKNDATAMLAALRESNENWKKCGPYEHRPLNVMDEPFHRPHWDVIILHPRAMLPDGQAIGIAQNRVFFDGVRFLPPDTKISWSLWTASGDTLYSDLNTPLAPFAASDIRPILGQYPISALAMVINAHCKLQQFMAQHGDSAGPRVKEFAALMSELVTEIFFVPGGAHNIAEQFLHISQPAQTTITPHLAPRTDDVAPPDCDGLNLVEHPETPDTDGLTDSEFRLVSAQACDPHLDSEQRANAAMMMIFGTHRYMDPHTPGLQAIR